MRLSMKTPQIDGWNPRYNKILVEVEKGVPVAEIAKKVGMHVRTVYTIMRKPEFLERRQVIEADAVDGARKMFLDKVTEAAQKIINLAKRGKPEERIQFDAAREILHQVGMKPPEVIETRQREYTPEEIKSSLSVTREVEHILQRMTGKSSTFIVQDELADLPGPSPEAPEPEKIDEPV